MASPPTGVPNAGGVDYTCVFDIREVSGSQVLPPKICVHLVVGVHNGALAEKYAV